MRWRNRDTRITARELEVIEALLRDASDPRTELLLQQVIQAPAVDRQVTRDGQFLLTIPETTEDLLVDLPSPVVGHWHTVAEATTGIPLELRVEIHGSGIFGALRGRTREGKWPSNWSISRDAVDRLEPVSLPRDVQPEDCRQQLNAWLGNGPLGAVPPPSSLATRPPAASADLDALEQREGVPLPADYRALLSITNGLRLAGEAVLGTSDTHAVELGGAWWVLAIRRGQDFVVTPAPTGDRDGTGGVYFWPHDAPERNDAHLLGRGVKDWLRDSVHRGSLFE